MKIAAIALRGMTILPGMVAHFDISRDKSIKAVEAAMNNNQRIFLVTQRDAEVDNPKMADLFEVGIVAEIKVSICHFSLPKARRKTVARGTIPTTPQAYTE